MTSVAAITTAPVIAAAETAAVERVVAVGEEFLLANLLALGLEPVASTATVSTEGFLGLDEFDVAEIEVLPFPDLSLERLAAIDADRIVIYEQLVELAGAEAEIGAIAPLTIVPDGLTPEAQLEFVAEAFGRTDEAASWLARLDEARTAARTALTGCEVSLLTIYAGPAPAIYIDERSPIPAAIVDAGCTLVPGADTDGADGNGRVYISLEQLGLLAAPQLLLISTDVVDGERQAIESVQESPLWAALPAVAAGEVSEVDRLGFPGVPGQIRLYEALVTQLGDEAPSS